MFDLFIGFLIGFSLALAFELFCKYNNEKYPKPEEMNE